MADSKTKALAALFVAPFLVGLVLWGINELNNRAKAVPALEYQTTKLGKGFADIVLKSNSSEAFLVLGVVYRVRQIVRTAPRIDPPKVPPPRPQRQRWFNRPTAPGSAKCGAPISPDDVVVNPGEPRIDQWFQGDQIFSEVEPYRGQVIHFQIHDPARAGARYRVEARVVYGKKSAEKTECVPEFEIDVVGK